MPALPPAEGIYRVVPTFEWDGQTCANVLHYRDLGETIVNIPQAIADNYETSWKSQIAPFVSSTCQLTSIIVTDLSADGAPSGEFLTDLPNAGTSAGFSLPNNVTLAISLRTAFRGRSFRGRSYFVGLTQQDVTASRVDTAVVQELIDWYGIIRILEAGATPVAQMVVLSYYANNALRGTPVATDVTSFSSDGIVDSQRRRLPGRGA